MTRREKPHAGKPRRGESTKSSESDNSSNPRTHAADSHGAAGEKALGFPKPEAYPRIKRIALVTMDRLDCQALGFALNACQRMDARLDIFTNLSTEETNQALIAIRGAADTPWRVIPSGGDSSGVVFRYARNESGLLFLVSGIGDEAGQRLRDRFGSEGIRPGIPWVVVESKRKNR